MAGQSFTNYLFKNPLGNTQAGTWNVLPAVLSTFGNFFNLAGNKSSYALYKEQAKAYVRAAKLNAQLLENQGAIALRNLVYKNKLSKGEDIVSVAASGTKLSGSNIDVLVRKDKIRKIAEMTTRANYSAKVAQELNAGYNQAAQAYGSLAAQAGSDKWAAIASIFKGVETYVGLQAKDAAIANTISSKFSQVENFSKHSNEVLTREYTKQPIQESISHASESFLADSIDKLDTTATSPTSLFSDNSGITINNIPFI